MKKINIGAGGDWKCEGWDVLDNSPSDYDPPWKFRGKCWDMPLQDDAYDLVFCSHMLEHVPHFRMEKTIAEFNRIMKTGGTVRILVPSLKKAAEAYVNNDIEFFSGSKHYSNHMGIGASFMRVVNSPGGQTVAFTREMDEILGGYAHLYSFDFEMLKILLEKWGFGDVTESEPGESEIEELQKYQHLVVDGKEYSMDDPFTEKKEFRKANLSWHYSGFDKTSRKQLIVEAKKIRNETYHFDKQFDYNKTGQMNSALDKLKAKLISLIWNGVDNTYAITRKLGIINIINKILRRS